jgi:hypoxanthine phosphoribosyltransferase
MRNASELSGLRFVLGERGGLTTAPSSTSGRYEGFRSKREAYMIEAKKPIFVSYMAEDQHIARQVVEQMRAADLDTFFAPQDIRPGSSWQVEIYSQLRSASALVAIFTPRSMGNAWVMAECSAAWILGIPVFSFAMFTPVTDLPAFASSLQALTIETPSQLGHAISEVKKRLASHSHRNYTWAQVASVMMTIDEELRDNFVQTDLVVGSGRGGAICGAMIASRRGIPLKVCDLQKGKDRTVDLTSLTKQHFQDRHVLVVEYYRNTGETFRKIEQKLQKEGAAGICSVAVLCQEHQIESVDVWAEKVKTYIRPPWQNCI